VSERERDDVPAAQVQAASAPPISCGEEIDLYSFLYVVGKAFRAVMKLAGAHAPQSLRLEHGCLKATRM